MGPETFLSSAAKETDRPDMTRALQFTVCITCSLDTLRVWPLSSLCEGMKIGWDAIFIRLWAWHCKDLPCCIKYRPLFYVFTLGDLLPYRDLFSDCMFSISYLPPSVFLIDKLSCACSMACYCEYTWIQVFRRDICDSNQKYIILLCKCWHDMTIMWALAV